MINTLRLHYEINQGLKLPAIGVWESGIRFLWNPAGCRHQRLLKTQTHTKKPTMIPLASQKTHHRWIHFYIKSQRNEFFSACHVQNLKMITSTLFHTINCSFLNILHSNQPPSSPYCRGKLKLIWTHFASDLDLPETFCSISGRPLSMSLCHLWSPISYIFLLFMSQHTFIILINSGETSILHTRTLEMSCRGGRGKLRNTWRLL